MFGFTLYEFLFSLEEVDTPEGKIVNPDDSYEHYYDFI